MTDSEAVLFTVDGAIATITLNRPKARNAVNGELSAGVEAAIDAIEADESIHVGILAGNGPVFCAGADLKAIAMGDAAGLATKRGGFGGFVTRERSKPIIAAVDGPALAGGTELCLAADLIVASTAARFGIPEVKRSLVAAAGGLFRLPRKLPINIAMELGLTGDPLTVERAAEFGLVNVLCEPGEALAEARVLAERITANAPLAVQKTRQIMLQAYDEDEATLMKASNHAMAELSTTEDFAEGPMAFIEKRDPVWKGR